MGVRSYIKNTFKDNTNARGWSGWDVIKKNAQIVGELVKDIKPASEQNEPPVSDTFEQAVQRYGLTDQLLKKRMRMHWWVAALCFLFSIIALWWGGRLLFEGMYLSALVSGSIAALMLVYAFYEHLSYCRIKYRRLNISVSEWVSYLLRRP